MKFASIKSLQAICFLLVLETYTPALCQDKIWSLDECINQALRGNILLNQDIANAEITKLSYEQAKANRIPNLNLNDQHSLTFGRTVNPVTNQNSNQNISANDLAISSSIVLYNGSRNTNLIKEYKLNCESSDLGIEKVKNDLKLNVIAAYMQVLFQQEAVHIMEAQISTTTEHLNYTERYVKAGSIPEATLFQMRAQLAGDKAAKVEAENQLQLAKVTLMQLMELPVAAGFEIEAPAFNDFLPDITMTVAEINDVAEGFLPEVKNASTQIRAAKAALRVSRSGILPKLTLTGNINSNYSSYNSLLSYRSITSTEHIGYLASDPSKIVDGPVSKTITNSADYPFSRQMNDNFGQGIALNLSVPIFNNLQYKSDIRRSEIAIRFARLNEQLVKNQLRKNIESAYTDQVAAGKNFMATKEQLASAELSYRNMTLKFKAGAINTTDLFVEKNNYNKALTAHLQAKYQYIFKTRILKFYLNEPVTN